MRTILAILAATCALAIASPLDITYSNPIQQRDDCNAFYIGPLLPLSVGNQPCGDPDGNFLRDEVKPGKTSCYTCTA